MIFNTKLRYNHHNESYIVWLISVILWNFAVPNAEPIEDVVVAIVLSFLSICLKKIIK